MKFVELFPTTLQEHFAHGYKHTKYHRNIAPLKRLFRPVYTSPDKHLNGQNVHGSAFRLHGTRGTKQIFERQTVLQCVTAEFEQFRVNGLHR